MYTSYQLISLYKTRQNNQLKEGYINDGDSSTNTTLDTVWLVAIGLIAVLDIILVCFGTYYTFKCQAQNKLPVWLAVLLILMLWFPSPIQPLLAVCLTIWGGVAGCN